MIICLEQGANHRVSTGQGKLEKGNLSGQEKSRIGQGKFFGKSQGI